jgi:hypothetical protein
MNAEQLRLEAFELMLELDRCRDAERVIELQFQIESKIDALISLTGLPQRVVELRLQEQYMRWLAALGHGTDEAGAQFP